MEIDLAEQFVLILADDGPFAGPLEAELLRCGATVTIRDPALIDSMIADVLKSAGRLDVLVFISPSLRGPEGEAEAARSAFAASVGNLNSIVEAASDALAEASGRIVVLGSAFGLLPSRRNPLGGLTDEALFTLVREAAMRLGSRKVRINGVALGAIVGAPGSTLLTGDEGLLSHAADKRPGTIQDVANAVLFLADPANTYMSGHILAVDGGWTVGFARDF